MPLCVYAKVPGLLKNLSRPSSGANVNRSLNIENRMNALFIGLPLPCVSF